jgi:hypothetical protein
MNFCCLYNGLHWACRVLIYSYERIFLIANLLLGLEMRNESAMEGGVFLCPQWLVLQAERPPHGPDWSINCFIIHTLLRPNPKRVEESAIKTEHQKETKDLG